MTLKQLIKNRSKELRSKSHVAFLNNRKVIDAKYAIAFQEESMNLVLKWVIDELSNNSVEKKSSVNNYLREWRSSRGLSK